VHDQVRKFTTFIKKTLLYYFIDKKVLDVGSGDINGNNRYLFENCEYEGNDVIETSNITIVSKTKYQKQKIYNLKIIILIPFYLLTTYFLSIN
jgi:hypothetical protein